MGGNNQLEPQPFEPEATLASDADRDQVTAQLEKAVGQGILTLDEFADRTDRALASRTRAELSRVVADLPNTALPVPADTSITLKTGAGTVRREGQWTVPSRIDAECGMGTVRIDFTTANCPHRAVTLNATCGSGTIVATVPRGWEVRLEQVRSGMGSVTNRATAPTDPTMPVLHVYAKTGAGVVKIKHPREPGMRGVLREWLGIH
ncbi:MULTISPECIES: DUF1707 domain-containing protein [unclassified Nocardia]|uniref:DUF1707 SHOCT-like domain-containing protein n=1 Tax=unclassified Nocardia TaxID=2637762 RepID=UPI001CE44E3B|nr:MULTISPECIES: DUF1707 domain-containing protein [unclassified Nocardia]